MSRLIAPIFAGAVVTAIVWVAQGPTWAVLGFGSAVLMLAALAEDHFHAD